MPLGKSLAFALTFILAVLLISQAAVLAPQLRFYRVRTISIDQHGGEHPSWTRWYLIDDRYAEDKAEFDSQFSFYRANKIQVERVSLPGRLPE